MGSRKEDRMGVGHLKGDTFALRRFARLAVFFALAGCCLGAEAQPRSAGNSEEYLGRLEWRGVLVLAGEVQFSLHDGPGGTGFWITQGQVRNGVEVVAYDEEENEVILRHGDATRTIVLSDSTVGALDVEAPTSPPPLVVIGGTPNGTPEGDEDLPDPERAARIWERAVEGSGQLREIDQQLQRINGEDGNVTEALSRLKPGEADYESVAARHMELQEERRVLTEGALTELQNSTALPGPVREEMARSLRAGFSHRIAPAAPPEPAGAEEGSEQ